MFSASALLCDFLEYQHGVLCCSLWSLCVRSVYLSYICAGNAVWAMGELFDFRGNDDDKDPYSLWDA